MEIVNPTDPPVLFAQTVYSPQLVRESGIPEILPLSFKIKPEGSSG